ncbi:MAG: SDR family NAD(P)-dependent oxidoreductase [Alphaproteobacteria bacterium]
MTNILITGASSGIGEALAYYYSKYSYNTLFLSGRNAERLNAVVQKCKEFGATVEGNVIDVNSKAMMQVWIEECHAKAPLNLVIANAGVSTDDDEDVDAMYRTFETNVTGVLNTILPTLELYKKETYKHRQIAVVSSIAAYYPMPQCPAYSASKACVKSLTLSFRERYKKTGIKFNVICPGFVRSRITDKNTCPMPFFMEANDSAKKIVSGLVRNKSIIAFPWQLYGLMGLISALPHCVTSFFMDLLPKKN